MLRGTASSVQSSGGAGNSRQGNNSRGNNAFFKRPPAQVAVPATHQAEAEGPKDVGHPGARRESRPCAEVECEVVRLSAVTALARLASLGLGTVGLAAVVHAMRERRPDRLSLATRHYAAAALRRDGSPAAIRGLVDGLMVSRWL